MGRATEEIFVHDGITQAKTLNLGSAHAESTRRIISQKQRINNNWKRTCSLSLALPTLFTACRTTTTLRVIIVKTLLGDSCICTWRCWLFMTIFVVYVERTLLSDIIPETVSAVDIRKRHMARVRFRATRISQSVSTVPPIEYSNTYDSRSMSMMGTQYDGIDISQIKAIALGVHEEPVSNPCN